MRFAVPFRRLLLLLLALSIPALLFLNVWQGTRVSLLSEEVRRLEEQQLAWFERNKELLARVGIYSSPRRIDAIGEEDPEIRRNPSEDPLRIRIEPVPDGAGGR